MSNDKIAEIRARLDDYDVPPGPNGWEDWSEHTTQFVSNAHADIAWLLDEVERLRGED
jgi:hypothetical protein